MNESDVTTGQLIKGARKKAGLTQSELAARIGITPQVISQYERGVKKNPKPATLKKIADAIGNGVKWYELYSGCFGEQDKIEESMPTMGELIRKAREKAGLTQGQLADAIRVTRSTVAKYEGGLIEPSVSKLKEMGRVLGCIWYKLCP